MGGQQHPFVHIGHSYVTRFKLGTVCAGVCAFYLSTGDQFNGNLIYLKKKKETQIVTVKLIKAVYFYF